MNDALHRILAGNPEHRRELIAAGIFVAVWFAIDVIQFGDWVVTKFSSPPAYAGPVVMYGSWAAPCPQTTCITTIYINGVSQ